MKINPSFLKHNDITFFTLCVLFLFFSAFLLLNSIKLEESFPLEIFFVMTFMLVLVISSFAFLKNRAYFVYQDSRFLIGVVANKVISKHEGAIWKSKKYYSYKIDPNVYSVSGNVCDWLINIPKKFFPENFGCSLNISISVIQKDYLYQNAEILTDLLLFDASANENGSRVDIKKNLTGICLNVILSIPFSEPSFFDVRGRSLDYLKYEWKEKLVVELQKEIRKYLPTAVIRLSSLILPFPIFTEKSHHSLQDKIC